MTANCNMTELTDGDTPNFTYRALALTSFLPKRAQGRTRSQTWVNYEKTKSINCTLYVIIIIIHRIFSLARDWSKHITWLDIPQLKPGNIRRHSPNACSKKCLKDDKHNGLLKKKICSDICPWTLSVPRSSQFSSSFALGKLFASRSIFSRQMATIVYIF